MNGTDLIRREDAIAAFIHLSQGAVEGMIYKRTIDAIPAVDAVEVVRCRDCAVPHNEMTGCPLLLGIRVDPDFYCKFGYRERREEEHNAAD